MVTCHPVEALLSQHRKLFEEGLGTLQGHKAKLYADPQAIPKFCKARSVPYAMHSKVEEELHRLVQEGILEPIQYADWAAPIVPVWKKDKESVRVCGDFKLTVNKVACLDRYPIPHIEDLLAKLAGPIPDSSHRGPTRKIGQRKTVLQTGYESGLPATVAG